MILRRQWDCSDPDEHRLLWSLVFYYRFVDYSNTEIAADKITAHPWGAGWFPTALTDNLPRMQCLDA
uniref:Transposase n=1 Tax=Ascaris lumbricoides TaxID=6252 RepID=A0A0M3I7N9_ASCLU